MCLIRHTYQEFVFNFSDETETLKLRLGVLFTFRDFVWTKKFLFGNNWR
jgi:hypothetical protein